VLSIGDRNDVRWQLLIGSALVRAGDASAIRKLGALAEDETKDSYVRSSAIRALARNGDERAAYVLESWVHRRFWDDAPLEGPSRLAHEGKVSRKTLVKAVKGLISKDSLLGRWQYGVVTCAEHRLYEFRNDLIIRILGWCGDSSSLGLLNKIPLLPCADSDPYDGGEQRRSLLAACSLAKWRIQSNTR